MVDYDLIVVGAGAGGLAAARAARRGGRRVALVEAGEPGGDCTHYGCIPSKTLIESARRVHAARAGSTYGFAADVTVDFAAVMRRVRATVVADSADESPSQLAREGIDLVSGTARFVDPHTVDVGGRRITAARFVLATGGGPLVPPLPGLADVPYLTNRTLFDLTTLPSHLLVLGGGPIGIEMAQAFARLGTQVTVVEALPRILPRDESEVVDVIARVLSRDGVTVRTGAKVVSVSAGPTLHLDDDGSDDGSTVAGSHLLVAIGRRPDSASVNPAAAGVRVASSGHFEVDDALRTSAPHIYAVGDCASRLQFTHVADEQGRHAAANAFGRRVKPFRAVVPWVTFTDPEVAHVGLTEAEAFERHGAAARVAVLPLDVVDRARCAGETEGFVKVIGVPRPPLPGILAGRIVGATVVAPTAGELLAEFVFAMQTKAFLGRVAQTVHSYPTWSLANRQAVALFAGYGGGTRPARPSAPPSS